MDAKLIKAVRKQLGGTRQEQNETFRDVSGHGADSGFSGFIYTDECAKFFERNADLIWDHAVQMADDLGEKNVVAMIAGFRATHMMESWPQFENLMAWFALEEVANHEVGD